MSTGTTKSPNLPIPPAEYSQDYMTKLNNALRLYFAQLDNAGPSAMSTQRVTAPNSTTVAQVISAINCSQLQPSNLHPGQVTQILSLPTQADYSAGLLRVGDVYVDETAGNVLKVRIS
jgi:hypothetical protein